MCKARRRTPLEEAMALLIRSEKAYRKHAAEMDRKAARSINRRELALQILHEQSRILAEHGHTLERPIALRRP